MTFLEAVNRILRLEGVIRGDDDDLLSFAESQHAATVSLAQLAVQAQLTELVADDYIPYEEKTATFASVNGTRTYGLAADFQQFQEIFFEELDDASEASGTRVVLYPGDERQLKRDFARYREDPGRPIYWYRTGGTAKTVGLFPVPDDARTYRYYYEADVSVTNASDTLPFVMETEAQCFVEMAARHFKYLKASAAVREQLFPRGIEMDPVIVSKRATLMALLRGIPKKNYWGKRYARA